MGTRSLTRVIPRQKGLSYDEGHKHVDKSSINICIDNTMVIHKVMV